MVLITQLAELNKEVERETSSASSPIGLNPNFPDFCFLSLLNFLKTLLSFLSV